MGDNIDNKAEGVREGLRGESMRGGWGRGAGWRYKGKLLWRLCVVPACIADRQSCLLF